MDRCETACRAWGIGSTWLDPHHPLHEEGCTGRPPTAETSATHFASRVFVPLGLGCPPCGAGSRSLGPASPERCPGRRRLDDHEGKEAADREADEHGGPLRVGIRDHSRGGHEDQDKEPVRPADPREDLCPLRAELGGVEPWVNQRWNRKIAATPTAIKVEKKITDPQMPGVHSLTFQTGYSAAQ